jgi:hypothetical protein
MYRNFSAWRSIDEKEIDYEDVLLALIEARKIELADLGEIISKVLSELYNVFDKKGFHCKDKENSRKHGLYFHLIYTWNGRGTVSS